MIEATSFSTHRVSRERTPQHKQAQLPGLDRSGVSDPLNCCVPRSSLVSNNDSRENTPLSTKTGSNLYCSRELSPLPPTPILVSLTSVTRPTSTRLESARVDSRSRPRYHSSCARDRAGPTKKNNRRHVAIEDVLPMRGAKASHHDWTPAGRKQKYSDFDRYSTDI